MNWQKKLFSDADVGDLGGFDSLPVPFVEDLSEIQSKSKRVYITYRRILEIGSAPGCRGCEGDSSNHNSTCVAQFEEAFGKPSASLGEIEPSFQEFDDVILDHGYEASIAPAEEEDVPECPPPSDSEEIFEDDPHGVDQGVGAIVSVETDFKDAIPDDSIQEIMNSVFSPSKQISCLGAAAKVHENTKGRHLLSGSNVLFEFCCDNDSNLGKVGEEEGVRVVRLSREMIYLSDDQAIQQLCFRKSMPFQDAVSTWQRLNMKKHPKLCEKIAEDWKASLDMVSKLIRVADIVLRNGGHVSYEWPRCWGRLD